MNGKISNGAQVAYVRRYVLTEGKEVGVRVVELNNGVIRLMLNESKALDIMQLWHEGCNISFVTKNGFSNDCGNFLNRFEGGMIYTCGLDSVGGREGFELHGSLHNHPAKIVRAERDLDGNITVVGVVEVTALFGAKLILTRTVRLATGSDTVELNDELYNGAFAAQDYCLLYHINVGYPMLDEGVKIKIDAEKIEGRNAWAESHLDTRDVMSGDLPSDEERCYFIKTVSPVAEVVNEKLGKIFRLEYSKDTLPCFVQWNSFASGDYALGLEPATTELDDRFRYNSLGAGKSVEFKLKLSVKNI